VFIVTTAKNLLSQTNLKTGWNIELNNRPFLIYLSLRKKNAQLGHKFVQRLEMAPILDRHNSIMQKVFNEYLMNVAAHFSEDELLRFGHFFTEPILSQYLKALDGANLSKFILHHNVPSFEEEIPIPFVEIWQIHHQFIDNLARINDRNALPFLRNFLLDRPFSEFLIILGQRITPASVRTKDALPPSKKLLFEQAFTNYNREINLVVRAWEKHVGRNETNFWGIIDGTPQQKEKHVVQLVNKIIENHTWWNVFEHFKHGHVYEIREENGHGMRWSLDHHKFIGFVEPF
jgi:hypothetical protein